MPQAVYCIGSARTDFKRNLKKEGKSLRDVILESARGAIADSGIQPGEIQSGIVGNFAAGLFTRQLHLGAFLTEIDPALRGLPTLHTEAACASGGVAVLTAAQQIMGGIYDVVLVVGAEQQKTMSPAEGSDVLGAAADYLLEKPQYGEYMFPKLFARTAQIYRERYGLEDRQLATVAAKNHAHARHNPLAQMRDGTLTIEQACAESEKNPRIAPPLKISDCSQITDGAAALLLCSEQFARKLARADRIIQLIGWGHSTDHMALEQKDVPQFSCASKAAAKAYDMARITPRGLHGAEVHDCFSISELIAYEILSFADRGGAPKLIDSGATAHPIVRAELGLGEPAWSLPVNVGGGLLGDGHPVGATGVRQIAEIHSQLSCRAGDRQIAGAKRYLAFNMGGSVTTSVVTIWESVPAAL